MVTMFEIATVTSQGTVQLPQKITRRLSISDRFIVWLDGDMMHLKKMLSSPLDLVEQTPAADPLSLDEINDIVHDVRLQHRTSQTD